MIVQDMLRQLSEDLKGLAKTETIFGEPMDIQGNTVIPVCRMSIGYGGGGGEGEGGTEKKTGGKGVGAGGGAWAKIDPSALIIAKDGELSVVGIKAKTGKLEALIEMIPETIEKIMARKSKSEQKPEEEEE
jgi:uncharacterized spore protein YtfJ